MNCEDARELTAASSRKIGLTELALVEAHLRRCAECREASRRPETPAPLEGVASFAVGHARLGAVGPALTARAGALAGVATRLGGALSARARSALAETARTAAGALRLAPRLRARAGDLRARLAAARPTPLRPAARLMRLGLLPMLALLAGHSALRPGPEGPSPIDTRADAMLAAAPASLDAEPASPGATEGRAPTEPQRVAPPESQSGDAVAAVGVDRPDPEIRRAASPPAPASALVQKPEPARAPQSAPKRVEAAGAQTAGPEPAQRRLPPLAHVAGQLSVKNRGVAERDLTALLARTGGSLVGTDRDGAVMFVDAVVPQSGYEEFTRGLTRIGAWRVEAERSPLPEDVHLTIRVGG
jgi:hypothetical protein